MEGGRPTMIPSAEGTSVGGKSFPSYVAFTKDGQLLVGEPARRQAVTNPDGTIKNVKRKMGSNEKVTALGKEYTPQQISAFILQKIKKDAESTSGRPSTKPSSPSPPTSTTTRGRQPRMPEPSPVWKWSVSSTSPPRPHSHTVWTNPMSSRRSWSSTSEEEPSMSPSWTSVTECSRSLRIGIPSRRIDMDEALRSDVLKQSRTEDGYDLRGQLAF